MQAQNDDRSMQEAMRLAGTSAGKQLLNRLQSQHSDAIQQVLQQAKSGDMQQAKQALSAMLSDPAVQALLKKAQEERHG